MTTVKLFSGTGASWSETEVARLVDGTVEVGRASSTTYPAHVDRDGTVCFGAPWTYGPAQTVLGHVNDTDRTVTEGMSRYADTIGSWDEDGMVWGGPAYRREKVGRCDPPSGAGAACLLLLFAPGAPHKNAVVAAAQPGSSFQGMEVKLPKEKKPVDPGHEAAVAVGLAMGVATYGIEHAVSGWLRRHSASAHPDPKHDAYPVQPDPTKPPSEGPHPTPPTSQHASRPAPAQQQTTPVPRTPLWVLVTEELLRPGTHVKNLVPVSGATVYIGTPDSDLVVVDRSLPNPDQVVIGQVLAADAEVTRILEHMRTFVDHETIDGKFGVATSWQNGYIDVQLIRNAYDNYLCTRDLVHIYAEPPTIPSGAARTHAVRDRWPPNGKLPWEEPIQAERTATYIRVRSAYEERYPNTAFVNTTMVPGAGTHVATPQAEIVQPDSSIPLTDPVYANTNPRADAEAHRTFEHLRTFIGPKSIDGHYGLATAYAMRILSLQDVRAAYANMLSIRDWTHIYFTPAPV